MKIVPAVTNTFNKLKGKVEEIKQIHKYDPVYHCITYKHVGCVHVDGYLCDLKTCNFCNINK